MSLFNNTVLTVARKELLDLFRDRRTVLLGLLMGPLLFPVLILGMSSMAEKRARTQLESVLELPVIGAEHAPNLVRHLGTRDIDAIAPPEDAERALREQDHDVVLRIPAGFPEQWRESRMATIEILYDSSRQDSRIPVERVRRALGEYGQQVGALRMISRGISPEATVAVMVAQRDVATLESRRGMLLAFLPYLLIFSAFVGGAYMVIDVTAGERERQSLEPLLATPSSRSALMSGKILAATALGLLSQVLILIALAVSLALAPRALQMVAMTPGMLAMLLLVLAPIVLIGCTLLTLISASVKSVKEAQSYMSVLMLLPIIPTVVLMVSPVKEQLWQFAVPFLAQNQMVLKLVRSEWIAPMEWLVYFASGFGLALVLWLMASRLYHREKLAISA
ncbi:ABC transporter permease [Luteimonas terricola]|uniref:Sodium ABC transporter permease n=1 Tax=Luteimonas terricola TaxID=645597 RepID=A0ABQ2E5N8_9GAMM|nr:ABC transporter permease [Luteimonas terricola]GGJ95533.1 sodium ABC transporter permease [Luteimonas terricola]